MAGYGCQKWAGECDGAYTIPILHKTYSPFRKHIPFQNNLQNEKIKQKSKKYKKKFYICTKS